MTTLHLINKPGQPFTLCQQALAPDDSILLIEDGVYLLQAAAEQIKKLACTVSCYCLETDHLARGVTPSTLPVTAVDYGQFVHLTTEHDKVISWF
ncbi:sulfurtransferase complex subunit TusB [Endozoicomonas sp. Mp262]|uniref:sulfurtransferase complex subunit TusB n=1 Tax=Endozoicomonas sp. Mp262 TaxID=2919499 RepID=UPI0021DA015C